MNNPLSHIEPKEIWAHFNWLNAIPRPSKKEQKVSDAMVAFGKQLGLKVTQDKALNVLIEKPATQGFENRKKVTLQAHLDMVHQKNNDTIFDFDKQGIDMFVDGDWVKAKGTTLGADNGLGVAAIMAVLSGNTIEHPFVEALFTIDEETGMTGAFELEPGFISGDILLNLDTEEDDEITIGCAGGIDITANKTYNPTPIAKNDTHYQISVSGLQGGHSGMDIHKQFGNANKILTRLLFELQKEISFTLTTFVGGNLRNAIPREANATLAIEKDINILTKFERLKNVLLQEYKLVEPLLKLEIVASNAIKQGLPADIQTNLLQALYACHHGVYKMDVLVKDLVATSNNLASVTVKNGTIEIACLTRSSIESEKQDFVNQLTATFKLANYKVICSGAYPGWQANPTASIVNVLKQTYQSLFNEKPHVNACHAGLECGIIGKPYPNMEMVSFGPTIKGAHSPEEKASISSTQKFWTFLKEILKNIPEKK